MGICHVAVHILCVLLVLHSMWSGALRAILSVFIVAIVASVTCSVAAVVASADAAVAADGDVVRVVQVCHRGRAGGRKRGVGDVARAE